MEQEAQTRVLPAPPQDDPAGDAGEVRPPAAAQVRDAPRPVTSAPAQIGRYALVRRLAHGGMATVYLGRVHGAAGFEKVVALKLIHPHLANEREFLEMFFDEARIAARIHHPHVVEILDLGQDQGMHYMAMEWVEGETLAALVRALRPGCLPLAVTLQVIADALDGLAAAHKLTDASGKTLGLVHRDVSPQNLLISMDGFVKVTDFGIMKAAGRHGSTRTGELRGKVAYMSPEQARGKSLDARSDLFAVGVIAWELLHGRRLFSKATDAATLERVMACEVPEVDDEALTDASPQLAASVRAWVSKALSRDPEARFDDARGMLHEVRSSLQLAGERDPRSTLAAVMKAEFGERVAYVRASLRGITPATQPVASLASVAAMGSGSSLSALSGPVDLATSPSISTTASQSISAGVAEVTGFGSQPRAWAALIVLPLLGAAAAVGIAYAAGLGRGAPAEAGTGAQAAATTGAVDDQRIRWFISTEPEGATLTIDGKIHDELTPTQVVLSRGEEPVTLLLTRKGMRATRATLQPRGDDNLFYRLVAAQAPGDSSTSGAASATRGEPAATGTPVDTPPKGPRIKKKFRPPSNKHAKRPGPAAGSTGETDKSEGGTGLRPMPDFDEEGGPP